MKSNNFRSIILKERKRDKFTGSGVNEKSEWTKNDSAKYSLLNAMRCVMTEDVDAVILETCAFSRLECTEVNIYAANDATPLDTA